MDMVSNRSLTFYLLAWVTFPQDQKTMVCGKIARVTMNEWSLRHVYGTDRIERSARRDRVKASPFANHIETHLSLTPSGLGPNQEPPSKLAWLYLYDCSQPPNSCLLLVSKRPKGNVFKSLWISALGAFVVSRWISLVCPCLHSRDHLCFPVSWCLMSGAQLRYDHKSRRGNINAASKPKHSIGYCRLSDHWLK